MPPGIRAAVEAWNNGHPSSQKVAVALGISLDAAKARMKRARKMRAKLAPADPYPSCPPERREAHRMHARRLRGNGPYFGYHPFTPEQREAAKKRKHFLDKLWRACPHMTSEQRIAAADEFYPRPVATPFVEDDATPKTDGMVPSVHRLAPVIVPPG